MTDQMPTPAEYLAQAGFSATTLADLQQKVEEAAAKIRHGLAKAGQQIQGWYNALVKALTEWVNDMWTRIQSFWDSSIQPWIEEVKKIWNLVVELVRKCINDLRNFRANVQLLINIHADMLSWIEVGQVAQQWYQDVERFHIDNGYNMVGLSSSRTWVGPAADSYVSLWPYQVRAGQRLLKLAEQNSANLGHLLTAGAALYVAWGMVFLQLLAILATDIVLGRWLPGSRGGGGGGGPIPDAIEGLSSDGIAAAKRGSSAGAGDVRTLMRLLATVAVARVVVQKVDEQTAAAMQTLVANRDGMGSGDRNWPNPLAVKEFMHPTIDPNGRVRIVAGRYT
ncbi:MAG: hypothetical protein J2P15_07690 [Micromonosporaceae bacterium]|nr:hypothetical protein [Micromonosporaceae bacterium]